MVRLLVLGRPQTFQGNHMTPKNVLSSTKVTKFNPIAAGKPSHSRVWAAIVAVALVGIVSAGGGVAAPDAVQAIVPAAYALCAPLGTACSGAIIVIIDECVDVEGKAVLNNAPNAQIYAELCVSYAGGMGPTAGSAIVAETQTGYVTVDWVGKSDGRVRVPSPTPNIDTVGVLVPTGSPECSKPVEDEAEGDIMWYEEKYCVLTITSPLVHGTMFTSAQADEAFECATVHVEAGAINGVEQISTPLDYPGCEATESTTSASAFGPTDYLVTAQELNETVAAALEAKLQEHRERYLAALDALLTPSSPANLVIIVEGMKTWVNEFLTLRPTTEVGVAEL